MTAPSTSPKTIISSIIIAALLALTACHDQPTTSAPQNQDQNTTQESSTQTNEAPEVNPLTITYLANEGLLLQTGEQTVLIDALFRQGVTGYATLKPETLKTLEAAQSPFDQIDAVLVTHKHDDHFNADSVATYLKNNSTAQLVTSPQVADLVRTALPTADQTTAKERINSIEPKRDQVATVNVAGIKIEFARLSHGSGRFAEIWNLGYVIHFTVQGDEETKRILHIGDAEFNHETTQPLEQFALNVDIACIPYWWLISNSARTYLTETLKPKSIIAIHIPPAELTEITQQIHQHLPDVIICGKPGKL